MKSTRSRRCIEGGADVNAKDGVRAQTPLMYAAASNRAAVIELLASKGADLKATNKVSDLANLSREGAGFGGNPQVPGGAPGSAAGAAGAAPARRAPMPGVDRNYQLNELIVAQGGLTPLLYAVRQGYQESTDALLKAGADINQPSAGDGTRPLLMAVINGHFDLAKSLLEKGAEPEYAERERRDAALRRAQRRVGAEGALSAAARAHAAEDRLSRADEAADRQGRRSERAPEDEGLVFGLQLRSVGRRRDRRERVLARRLRQRRRGDAAAGRRRRRSERADDEAGGPRRASATCSRRAKSSISQACRRCRLAVRR